MINLPLTLLIILSVGCTMNCILREGYWHFVHCLLMYKCCLMSTNNQQILSSWRQNIFNKRSWICFPSVWQTLHNRLSSQLCLLESRSNGNWQLLILSAKLNWICFKFTFKDIDIEMLCACIHFTVFCCVVLLVVLLD